MMSKVQIERLMDEVIRELLAEYKAEEEKKAQEKEQEQEFLTFDMALNYLLSEYRKGNTEAKIRSEVMPEGDYIAVADYTPKWLPFLYYYVKFYDMKRPYTPNDNSIFARDWQIIK